MMDNIFYYINILLPRYKCVTLPGLGAFILNKEGAEPNVDSILSPIEYTISFNGDLQHDDGVLSSYIQAVKTISYEAAGREVAVAVKEIKNTLLYEESVVCGVLGELKQIEGVVLFHQKDDYVNPSNFGLTPVTLETVNEIINASKKESKKVVLKRRLVVASVAAAAALLLLLPSNVIRDSQLTRSNQEAGYLKSLIEDEKMEVESNALPMIEELETKEFPLVEDVKSEELPVNNVVDKKKSGRTYYIVVGGASSMNDVERILKIFENDGLSNLHVVESVDRYRIYTKSFDDKAEAEKAVIQFRIDNPKYETAWVHSQKN